MTEGDHMDELGTLFTNECHENGTFGVAIRMIGENDIRLICRKVPVAALAQLLRQAADTCEASELAQIVNNSQIN